LRHFDGAVAGTDLVRDGAQPAWIEAQPWPKAAGMLSATFLCAFLGVD
jgi:hypothetical protein